MKKLTIILMSLVLALTTAQAQFSENFDQDLTSLSSNCWSVVQVNYSTTSGDVINGTGSAYTNPPTSGSGERTITTPFLNVNSTSFSVSFNYKTSSKITGNATRTIELRLVDRYGNKVTLQTLTMDRNSPTIVLTHNATYTLPTTGVYRFELAIGGATGDGNSRVIFDDLAINASARYGPVSHCNPAAVAVNDSYNYPAPTTATGNVLANDNIPADNEVYTPSVVTPPSSGTLVLNADGSFTYTPDPTFTGGTITFTYRVADNGYTPTTSNIATVTLVFPTPIVLPVELKEFRAIPTDEKVSIQWKVAGIEDGDFFEVQRSEDGNEFTTFAKVLADNHTNVYSALDKAPATIAYYRLRMVNLDGTITLSKTIIVRASSELSGLQVRGTTVGSVLNFAFEAATAGSASVQLFSVSGTRVQQSSVRMMPGHGVYSVDASNLPAGIYVIAVVTENTRSAAKFVKN